jgi:CRP-like cAMP-binding protein
VRAVESSTVLVVTRASFMAVMGARSDEQFRSKLEFLTSVPLLHSLDRKSLRPFVEKLSLERVHKDTVLVRQGDPPKTLYFILTGEARVLRHVPDAAFATAGAGKRGTAAAEAEGTAVVGLDGGVGDGTVVSESASPTAGAGAGAGAGGRRRGGGAETPSLDMFAEIPDPFDGAQGDDFMLLAAASEQDAAPAAAAHALEAHNGAHPLSVPGQTLELGRLGPRSFFGELAILNEAVGGTALSSVVSASDMRLLAIHMIDFKNTADAAMEAAFRANARTYPTDAALVSALSEGTHWRRYKHSLVNQIVQAQAEPKANALGARPPRWPVLHVPGAGDARIRRKFLVSTDGYSTPILRSALFDMAVHSARKASSQPPPPTTGLSRNARRPPPMLTLPEIAARVNNSAARAGILHAGSRLPRSQEVVPRLGKRGGPAEGSVLGSHRPAHWVDDPRQWTKFKEWGASDASKEDYKNRLEKHLREATAGGLVINNPLHD